MSESRLENNRVFANTYALQVKKKKNTGTVVLFPLIQITLNVGGKLDLRFCVTQLNV